jgi:site-specific DNA-cytosine methylase
MRVIWQSEIDPYASRVLKKHWPDVPNLGDITKVDWSTVERPDLVCGGYPCQPFSYAGRRNGVDDPRHLWPHFADALRYLRPRWALLENVPGHLSLGFDEVLADLAALGFDAEWSLVSACSVGAPHLRRRLFCVAYPAGQQTRRTLAFNRSRQAGTGWPDKTSPSGRGRGVFGTAHWDSEPGMGRVVDGLSEAVDRLHCLGNAVVPQVAEYVGRLIVNATKTTVAEAPRNHHPHCGPPFCWDTK